MIYCDENVWMPVAEGLRRRGWDVTTAVEEGTLGYTDRQHIRYASDNGRVILTFDDDFLSLVESEYEGGHPGVVYVSQHGRDVGELIRRIDSALEREDVDDLSGRVVYG
jgi:predicted nuclease of predicted toxin-antitoxin system